MSISVEEVLDKYDKETLIYYSYTMVNIEMPKSDIGWYNFDEFSIRDIDKEICISVYHKYKKTMPKETNKLVKKQFRYLKKRLKELGFIEA